MLVCGRGTMLSEIFGGMKDEGQSGSVRGRREGADRQNYNIRAGLGSSQHQQTWPQPWVATTPPHHLCSTLRLWSAGFSAFHKIIGAASPCCTLEPVQSVPCELYTCTPVHLYSRCTAVACEDLFILGQNITLHSHSTTTTTTSHQHQTITSTTQATVSR